MANNLSNWRKAGSDWEATRLVLRKTNPHNSHERKKPTTNKVVHLLDLITNSVYNNEANNKYQRVGKHKHS